MVGETRQDAIPVLKGATIIGNGPEVLKHVSMIGNDTALDSGVGVCGKEAAERPRRRGAADPAYRCRADRRRQRNLTRNPTHDAVWKGFQAAFYIRIKPCRNRIGNQVFP